MSFFKNLFSGATHEIEAHMKKFNNKNFLNAVLWACGLIGAANGQFKECEVNTALEAIHSSPNLKVFDKAEIAKIFSQEVCPSFAISIGIGKIPALHEIKKVSYQVNPEEAQTVLAVCCAIGASDGDFDDDEKKQARDVASALGVPENEWSDYGI